MSSERFKKGFSLIETISTIALIALVATITIVAINPTRNFTDTFDAQVRDNVRKLAETVELYQIDNSGDLPTASGAELPLIILGEDVLDQGVLIGGLDSFYPTYLEEVPQNPENQDYFIARFGSSFVIGSELSDGTIVLSKRSDVSVADNSDGGSDGVVGSGYCIVNYTIDSEWATGFVATVTINNTSGSDIDGWNISWDFLGDQQITSSWNISLAQNGQTANGTNLAFNNLISDGNSVNFGFQANHSGSNQALESGNFTVNGNQCTGNVATPDGPQFPPDFTCEVDYNLSEWNNGFSASIDVTNTSTSDITSWNTDWEFTGDESITSSWGLTNLQQLGQNVIAQNESYNGTLAAGQAITFGIQGTKSGTIGDLSSINFSIGGVECTIAPEQLVGNGLCGFYYDYPGSTGSNPVFNSDYIVDVRENQIVNSNYGFGGPGSPVPNDNFLIRYTGEILASETGTYSFRTNSDDGMRVFINGALIINDWSLHAAQFAFGNINLTQGERYSIVVEYFEAGGESVAELDWQTPSSVGYSTVPANNLFSSGCSSEVPNVTIGNGLCGFYYDYPGSTGSDPVFNPDDIVEIRENQVINGNYGSGGPGGLVPNDDFLIRFTGEIFAEETGTFTFRTYSDDGMRVYIDGQLVVNDWSLHGARFRTGTINLTENNRYSIVVEYFERGGSSVVRLDWQAPSSSDFSIVPDRSLFSNNCSI